MALRRLGAGSGFFLTGCDRKTMHLSSMKRPRRVDGLPRPSRERPRGKSYVGVNEPAAKAEAGPYSDKEEKNFRRKCRLAEAAAALQCEMGMLMMPVKLAVEMGIIKVP